MNATGSTAALLAAASLAVERDALQSHISKLEASIREAFDIMNEAPLLSHEDSHPPNCDICLWLNKVQKWYGGSGIPDDSASAGTSK